MQLLSEDSHIKSLSRTFSEELSKCYVLAFIHMFCTTEEKYTCGCNCQTTKLKFKHQKSFPPTYVTGFVKTVPNGTAIEIHFMA